MTELNKEGECVVWISLILLLNGIFSFAYALVTAADTTTLWAMLAINFVFFVGITQAGIVFSSYMRIAKSEWGLYFSRLGEVLTLSFIPAVAVLYLIIYLGGMEHLFWWASKHAPAEAGEHGLSPWLGKRFFVLRIIITMGAFYFLSYIYFRAARIEEAKTPVSYDMEKRLNTLAGIVMVFFILAESNLAWDFGMMIIPHWESTIFPAYVWIGHIFAGAAFLLLASRIFINAKGGLDKDHLDSMGKLLLGFTLLWIYIFWSQHIVTWYGDLPNIRGPLNKQMTGNYTSVFLTMLFAVFIIPFFALAQRRVKRSAAGLSTIAVIICAGVWLNRYLIILPVYADGSSRVVLSWTGISLILAGLSVVYLSVNLFFRLFPGVSLIRK